MLLYDEWCKVHGVVNSERLNTSAVKVLCHLCSLMRLVSSAPWRDAMIDMRKGKISSFPCSLPTLTATLRCCVRKSLGVALTLKAWIRFPHLLSDIADSRKIRFKTLLAYNVNKSMELCFSSGFAPSFKLEVSGNLALYCPIVLSNIIKLKPRKKSFTFKH